MQRKSFHFLVLATVLLMFGLSALGGQVKKETQSISVSDGGILEFKLQAGGQIRIEGWDRPVANVEYDFVDSEPYLVNITKTKSGLKIESDHRRGRVEDVDGLRINVMLPKKFNIEMNSNGGDLTIENLEGSFNGKNLGGDLNFHNVRGQVRLLTMGGDIRVTDSDLDGSLKTMGGEVLFRNVSGEIEGSSRGGEIRYDNVRGRDGRFRAPEKLSARGMTAKTVAISTMGGGIEIKNAPEGANVHTMGGKIRISGASRFVRATTMGGNIAIRIDNGCVNALTMSGDIDVVVEKGLGDGAEGITLKSLSGDIKVTVPEGLSLTFDLKISYTRNSNLNYRIAGDFAIKEERTKEWEDINRSDNRHDAHGSRKYIYGTGSTGSGKYRVKIETVNGDITIRKGR